MTNEDGARTLNAAYQGERGAFSEEAASLLLGPDIQTTPCRTFDDMFDSVSGGTADCAVAPIENTLAGSVHKNYDLLIEHDLTIIGEAKLRITHNLIAPRRVSLNQIRRVYSHPVALAQCDRFFRSNPQIEAGPAYDTAGSVKMVVERDRPDEAAIAGPRAAAVYGAHVIAEGLEDNALNFTRFLLLARPDRARSITTRGAVDRRKTSLMFRLANRPGELFRALAAFALREVDLSKIESRPIEGRPWEYSFYIDVIGDQREPAVGQALAHLSEMTETVRVLGSYPAAEELGAGS
ncbi:MAG TPA: prephenate dehydratase [Blastocatellia bacterium]|nr:prephenate dehydratase [Blastocatellia bacterium]